MTTITNILVSGKIKRDRLLSHKSQHISKKFSNARWIYQQIQNKIGVKKNEEERNQEQVHLVNDDIEPPLEEQFTFCPLVTSTPNSSQTDLSSPDCVSENHWHSRRSMLVSTEDNPYVPHQHHQAPSSTGTFNFDLSQTHNSHKSISYSSAAMDVQDNMDWRTLFSGRNEFEMDQNFSFRSNVPSTSKAQQNEDEGWEECFSGSNQPREEKNLQLQERPTTSTHRKRKRRGTQSNKENVAIKNVKKLIMYVNNY